jgi:Domain of unknown function (DUF2019)
MKLEQIPSADEAQLIGAYRQAAKLHGQATERGDHEAANKSAELVAAVYAELRRRGGAAQAGLLSLLVDSEPAVRLWSASHALEFSPAAGEAALEQLCAAGRFLGFTAKTTLKEWRAGRLRFP